MAEARNGVVKSEKQIQQEKLEIAKKNTTEAIRQYNEYNKVVEAAYSQYLMEQKKGKISAETQKNFDDAMTALEDLNIEITKSRTAEILINSKINSDDKKLKEDIEKIEQQAKDRDIEFQVKMGIVSETEKIENDIEKTKKQINDLEIKIESPIKFNLDEKGLAEAKAALAEANRSLINSNEELVNKNEDERIKNIEDRAVREREVKLRDIEKTYKEELKLAQGNNDLIYQAFVKMQEAKVKVEKDYLQQSSSAWETEIAGFLGSISKAFGSMDFSNNGKEQIEENLRTLNKEEQDLRKSFLKREITQRDFNDKILELERKKNDELDKLNMSFVNNLKSTLQSTFKTMQVEYTKGYNESVNKYIEMQNTIGLTSKKANDAFKKSEKAKLDGNIKDYNKYLGEYNELKEKQNEMEKNSSALTSQAWTQVGMAIAASFGQIATGAENGFKIFVLAALDALHAVVRIYEAEIIGKALAEEGWWGLIRASALTVALEAAVALAKSAAATYLKAGAVNLQGPGTETSDSIPARLSKGESVVTAKGTRAEGNIEYLTYVNAKGKGLIDYIRETPKVKERLLNEVFAQDRLIQEKTIDYLIQVQIDKALNNDNSRIFNAQNAELAKKLDKLEAIEKAILDGNYRRRTINEVDVNIELSDKEIIKRVNIEKQATLRRR